MSRIVYINPVGTANYDDLMIEALEPLRHRSTTLDVIHLEDVPEDITYFTDMHRIESELIRLLPDLESSGYDAAIIGCCFDPAVRLAREVVAMPVIGPFEAAVAMHGYFGHSFSVVTDSAKTAAYLDDLLSLYAPGTARATDWIEGIEVSENAKPSEQDGRDYSIKG